MPYENNQHLEPVSDYKTIWKYMTFEHFKDLITTKALYFRRVGAFEDVFEGKYAIANKHLRPEVYKDSVIPRQSGYNAIEQIIRNESFACCFHMSKYETAFMWNLYAESRGIAIKTTTSRLKRALVDESKKIYLSPIRYIDYDRDFLWEGNIMYLAFHKRKSFAPEKELRALILDQSSAGADGVKAKVDLKELLYEVYVSPYAERSIVHDMNDLLLDNGLRGVKVTVSDLYTMR